MALILSLLPACGSSLRKTAWSEEVALWFSNAAAQPTDPPRSHWEIEQQELLLKRLGHADVCALGLITSVGAFRNRDEPEQITFTFMPTEFLYGSLANLDQQGQLILNLSGKDLDLRRAFLVQRYLPGKRFLIFLKRKPGPPRPRPATGWRASLWRPPPPDPPVYGWALYRPEAQLITEVRALYRQLRLRK